MCARFFKDIAGCEKFMNELVVLSPIDDDDLEVLLDTLESVLKETAAKVGDTFKPLNRTMLREINHAFGTGKLKTPMGVESIISSPMSQALFTAYEATAIFGMVDLACVPTFGVDRPEL